MSIAPTLDCDAADNVVATRDLFHVGLNVSDLDRSVRFYSTLFGQSPSKHYGDYARFEIAEPPIVVALYPSPQIPGGPLNHVGIRLRDSAQLVELQRRLEAAGIRTQRQEDVECCYSRQTKFWVTDPDSNLWELYTLHDDLDHSGFDDPPVASRNSAPEAVWEHRLTEPIPNPLPFGNDSLDEVRLEGTFNALVNTDQLQTLIQEISRVLKSGGRIVVHGLVSDRPFPGTPELPGMAAMVQRVPVETEPLTQLQKAGFVDLLYDKLGDIHCFQVNGVELRELRLSATKPAAKKAVTVSLVYKGPYLEIELDEGLVLKRGQITVVSEEVAQRLMTGSAAQSFGLVHSGSAGEV